MRIVVAGCGRVGSDLALSLAEIGHDVSVIDDRPETFRRLGSTFNGTIHEGVAYDVRLLREAGIEFADAFVAVTNSDNANVMAVQLAKEVFGVPRTIARLDDPARADAYRALDISYIAGAKLTSRVFYEQLLEAEFEYHVTFAGGDVEIVDLELGTEAEGMRVADLQIEDAFRVAAVRRGRTTYVPDEEFQLRAGDLVVGAARSGSRAKLKRYLAEDD